MTLFHHFSINLRTLYIVWSLVTRQVTRRLTRLKTMCNVLKSIAKYFKTLRCGCDADALIFSIYLKPVLYTSIKYIKIHCTPNVVASHWNKLFSAKNDAGYQTIWIGVQAPHFVGSDPVHVICKGKKKYISENVLILQ